MGIQNFGTSNKDAISACEKGQERQPVAQCSDQCLRDGVEVAAALSAQPEVVLAPIQLTPVGRRRGPGQTAEAAAPNTISACEKGEEEANAVVAASTPRKETVESQIARVTKVLDPPTARPPSRPPTP